MHQNILFHEIRPVFLGLEPSLNRLSVYNSIFNNILIFCNSTKWWSVCLWNLNMFENWRKKNYKILPLVNCCAFRYICYLSFVVTIIIKSSIWFSRYRCISTFTIVAKRCDTHIYFISQLTRVSSCHLMSSLYHVTLNLNTFSAN